MEQERNEGTPQASRKQQNSEYKFIKGLFCGVALTLVCLTASMVWYQWRLGERIEEAAEKQGAAGEAKETSIALPRWEMMQKSGEIEKLINLYYMGEMDSQQVEDGVYSGLVAGLADPYSQYYSRENMELMQEAISGVYSGIGVTMMQERQTGAITVVSCFENTPATEAGILPGDVVTGIGDEALGDMDLTELVSIIKTGKEDTIVLNLLREGEEIRVEVQKRDIQVPTVSGKMLEEGIGYLQILEFDAVTTQQFQAALEELQEQGMKKLVIDLRDNPGGDLDVVCEILDQILPEGLIVYMEDKYGERREYLSDQEHVLDIPMAVLINENSASASEIFAGAIKDYGLGTLVGTTTYGKGVVQRIFTLGDGTGLKLTIAKYFTPKGTDIHEKGIEPDVEVELDESLRSQIEIPEAQDNQLQKALEVLKEQ